MATTSDVDTFLPSWLRPLLKLNEYVIGITLVAYITGFIITNVYLGSLGVATFDVLRVRYILIGVLFVVFLSTIFLPFTGAIAIVRSENGRVKPSLFVRLAMHTFQSYGVIFLALLAIYALAGSASTPVGIPGSAPPLPFSSWLSDGFIPVVVWAVRALVAFLLVGASIFPLGYLFVLVVNPRDANGVKRTRMVLVKQFFRAATRWRNIWPVLRVIIGIFLLNLGLGFAGSLLTFIGDNTVVRNFGQSGLSTAPGRFVAASFAIYMFGLTFWLFVLSLPPIAAPPETPVEEVPSERVRSRGVLVSYLILFTVPVYALGIYPRIPQQIGGGAVTQVEIVTSNDQLVQRLSPPTMETYLIDRTSSTSLIYVLDKTNNTSSVMEVTNSEIESIIHKRSP